MNTTSEMRLTRGSRQYAIGRRREIANDRFVGSLDGAVVVEGDTPEGVLASLIQLDRRDRDHQAFPSSGDEGDAPAASG